MKTSAILTIAASGLLFVAGCKSKSSSSTTDSSVVSTTKTDSIKTDTSAQKSIKPTGPAPAWAPDIKPEMQAVIEKLGSYGDKPIPQLTAVQARKNHTPTDAVMA